MLLVTFCLCWGLLQQILCRFILHSDLLSPWLLNSLPLSAIGRTQDGILIYYYHVCINKCTPNLLSDILHQESHHQNLIWGAGRMAGWRIWVIHFAKVIGGQGKEFRLWSTVVPLRSIYPHYDYLHSTQSFSFSLSAFLIFSEPLCCLDWPNWGFLGCSSRLVCFLRGVPP